jgi:glycosyltransferase involved in cell wall biosynthesis
MKLSVIMPVFNEYTTVQKIVLKVLEVDLEKELIVVDDRSGDGSWEIMVKLAREHEEIRLFRHEQNRGKGAALRTGFEQVQGEVVVIQDADLEYDPGEFVKLLEPIADGRADVVYGTRFAGGSWPLANPIHTAANKFLTLLSNLATGLDLTDMETCYKMFKAELLEGIELTSDRFNIEPELTAAFAKTGARVFEVPIHYAGRSRSAGKKIGFRDGIEAIYSIIKFNLFTNRK